MYELSMPFNLLISQPVNTDHMYFFLLVVYGNRVDYSYVPKVAG